jgi:zinc D-Ala-D-Ala carboxypeptidase
MADTQLSEHFWLNELLVSSEADRRGIANDPTPEHLDNITNHLVPGLELVRAVCGNKPMVVTSAYRCPALNTSVGGTATSAHPKGFAADLRVAGLSSLATAKAIAAAMGPHLHIDQLILESGRSVVHVSFDPHHNGGHRMMRGHQPGPAGTHIDWHYFGQPLRSGF